MSRREKPPPCAGAPSTVAIQYDGELANLTGRSPLLNREAAERSDRQNGVIFAAHPSTLPAGPVRSEPASAAAIIAAVSGRLFVKYTFLKVDPAWRRLDAREREAHKREFTAACEDFADGHLLQMFSLVGTRGDAELLLVAEAENLDRIHEFHVVLAQETHQPIACQGDASTDGRVLRRSSQRAIQVVGNAQHVVEQAFLL